jgi:cation transport regulator ChaC
MERGHAERQRADIASELEIVWRREMVTGAYRPAWVMATPIQ